jgi:hypothetical protein
MQIWNFVAWCQVCHTTHSMGVAICQGILQVMSFMLWDIHGTFNLFSVLPVL